MTPGAPPCSGWAAAARASFTPAPCTRRAWNWRWIWASPPRQTGARRRLRITTAFAGPAPISPFTAAPMPRRWRRRWRWPARLLPQACRSLEAVGPRSWPQWRRGANAPPIRAGASSAWRGILRSLPRAARTRFLPASHSASTPSPVTRTRWCRCPPAQSSWPPMHGARCRPWKCATARASSGRCSITPNTICAKSRAFAPCANPSCWPRATSPTPPPPAASWPTPKPSTTPPPATTSPPPSAPAPKSATPPSAP